MISRTARRLNTQTKKPQLRAVAPVSARKGSAVVGSTAGRAAVQKPAGANKVTDITNQAALKAKEVAPACPSCGGAMVKRTARRGANAGKGFWGCADYPKCRGTSDL